MPDEAKVSDILGIKPIGNAIEKITSSTVDGAANFLGRICLPAAEEFGLLLRDKIRGWRARNLAALVEKAKEKVGSDTPEVHAPPRLVSSILETGSWIEDSEVQDMWAGLLASSCTPSGDDDSNLIFTNLLSQLTRLEAKMLRYCCETAEKHASALGLIMPRELLLTLEELPNLFGEPDIHRLDRELDHLRELGLIGGGIHPLRGYADLTPSALALNLYVRCQGSRKSAVEYFGLTVPPRPSGGEGSSGRAATV